MDFLLRINSEQFVFYFLGLCIFFILIPRTSCILLFFEIVQIVKNPNLISSSVIIYSFILAGLGALILDAYNLSIFFKWKRLAKGMKGIQSNISGILTLFRIMSRDNFDTIKVSLSKMLEEIKNYDDGSGEKIEKKYLINEYKSQVARDVVVGKNEYREELKNTIAKKLYEKFGITSEMLSKIVEEN